MQTQHRAHLAYEGTCSRPQHHLQYFDKLSTGFRRDNPVAIKKVFRATVQMARYFDLIGGTLIAGDSTKLRAQNSKKNNFNSKKIERHLAYIEEKLARYQSELAQEDGDSIKKEIIAGEIEKQSRRRAKYESLLEQLDSSGQEQKEHLYKRRQAIIEHNYGTIKRQWNFHYIITKKGSDRASSDVGFMFVAYNLRRIFNLVDQEALRKYLKMRWLNFLVILDLIGVQRKLIQRSEIYRFLNSKFLKPHPNSRIWAYI